MEFCFAPAAKSTAKSAAKSTAKPAAKAKTGTLCSMHIFRGYQREWFIPCHEGDIPRPYGEPEMRDGQLFMQAPNGEYAVREVWVGCKGYCQRGLDICAVHAKSRMRQQRKAATLIQSIARRNRSKKLVAGLFKTFGNGNQRDVFIMILDALRAPLPLYKAAPKNLVYSKGSR